MIDGLFLPIAAAPAAQSTLASVLAVMGVHILAALSPGPDIALVLRNSLAHGRRAGILTSIGVGIGNLTHVAWALLGFGVLIMGTPWLVRAMQWAAGLYLIYLGLRSLRARGPTQEQHPGEIRAGAAAPEQGAETRVASSVGRGRHGKRRPLLQGLVSCSLNPKATLFYLSVFTVLLDPETTPTAAVVALAVYLPLASVALFSGVATLVSLGSFRTGYARHGHWLDRAVGLVLVALGLSLAFSRIT